LLAYDPVPWLWSDPIETRRQIAVDSLNDFKAHLSAQCPPADAASGRVAA
jgi:hypothetical protein